MLAIFPAFMMLGIATFVLLVIAWAGSDSSRSLLSVAGVSLAVFGLGMWTFSRITITVDADRVRWKFAGGILRLSLRVSQIDAVQVVPNFSYGPNLRTASTISRYNITGGKGVVITEKSGWRIFLGTDDAEALAAVIGGMVNER
jgi:hypothetical protein